MSEKTPMIRTLVLNSKGGAGKTTVATNLASLLALHGSVLLADLDPQQSSLYWSLRRSPRLPRLQVLADAERDFRDYPCCDYVVMDAPAGLKKKRLEDMLGEVEVLLVPIGPSVFDLDASRLFLKKLEEIKRYRKGKVRMGVIANRVDARTRGAQHLQSVLAEWNLPVVATLRDSQMYVRAAQSGAGIADLRSAENRRELPQWARILQFVRENGGGRGT
ncbi:AAA family ATPase [Acidithiobacillus sp. M4-SHS-6]|uniref:nucleotide-binding protein n=1 Tax=Acidithiobacillus sp. M4-SHS-6 TaxID=3383024 RepID=UPI0039BDB4E0